jgi:hypothetical protein
MAAMTAAAFLCAYACQVYDESDLEEETPEDPGEVLTGGRAPTGGAPFVAMPNSGSGGVPAMGGAGSRGGGGSGGRSGVTGSMGGGQITGNGGSEAGMGGDSGSPGGAPDLGPGGAENPGGATDPGGGSAAIGGGGTTGGAETGGASTGGAQTPPELIDDCENGNNQILVKEGRNGYWSTFGPPACNLSPPSVPNSMMAAQFMTAISAGTGTGMKALHFVSQGGDEDSCGVGFDFLQARNLYDASAYAGVSFGAQSVTGDQIVLVKVSTAGTDPKFGFCDENAESGSGKQCYDHFFAEVMLGDTWRDYTVSFADLVQEGWGFAPPDGFDPAEIVGVQWVAKPGTANIWIDDVKFVE